MITISAGKKHTDIGNPNDFYGVKGGEIIGYSGDKDKSVALVKVDNPNNFSVKGGNRSMQLTWINTDKDLTVLNNKALALDDEVVKAGDAQHRRVETWDDAFFGYYADDESDYLGRLGKFGDSATHVFDGGDDSGYLYEADTRSDKDGTGGSGNGAMLQIGIV